MADMSDDALSAKTSQRVVPPWIMPTRKWVKGIAENPASLASVVSRLVEPGWNVVAFVQRAAAWANVVAAPLILRTSVHPPPSSVISQ